MSENFQEFPVNVTYYTNSKILCQKEFGSFAHFGSILNYFERNLKQSDQLKLKPKYILDNKKVENNDLLMNLIQIPDKSKKIIISANLIIEIDEKSNITEKNYPYYVKILQPKLNPFGLYILNSKEGALSFKHFPIGKENEKDNELDKINVNSACCNSDKDLFVSGGIYDDNEINNFWIINHESFNIKNVKMLFNKSDHSMIYVNHYDEEFIFIAGGKDLKTFYYNIKSKRFSKWGNMNYAHNRPALIYIDNYIYCFDTSTKKNDINFERTNLDDISHKWEKIVPNFENAKIRNLVNKGFGVVSCGGGKIMLCGGDIINMNPYLYDVNKNLISINENCDDILFAFSDKNFYKINNNSYIALPSSLDEEKEILLVDKNKFTLDKININSKEGKSKIKNNDVHIQKIQDSLFGNIHLELKTKDIIPEKKDNKEIDNQIANNNNDKYKDNNISYFEIKPEENKMKNKIFEKINDINFENKTEENNYILNNHNFTNYKKERIIEKEIYDDNYNENNSFNDDFEDDKKNKCPKKIDIKLNYDEAEDIYEVEGNNFIYDSNKKNFIDIPKNNAIFINKNLPKKDYNNIINNQGCPTENKNEKNDVNKKDDKIEESKEKEKEKEDDNNEEINIIEYNNNNNEEHNNIGYNEEKIEENENNNLNDDNKGVDNEENNDLNLNDNKGYNEENNIQNNDEFNEEHLEENEEEKVDQNKNDDAQNEEEEKAKNDEQNIEQQNNEQNDGQDNEENNEENNVQYNEENIEGSGFDEENQINNNEELENHEEFNENENANVNEDADGDGDIEEYKDEMELEDKQNNNMEHEENNLEENNVEENNEENNNGEEQEENDEAQEYDEPQERDKFQQTITQQLGEDIIQIENHPALFYYDENNFCDYDYKPYEIEF